MKKKYLLTNFILVTLLAFQMHLANAYVITASTKSPQETLKTLIDTNQLIVIGSVLQKSSYYRENNQFSADNKVIATDHIIHIEKVLKGSITDKEITVVIPGGCIEQDNVCFKSDVSPKLQDESKLMLFLNPTNDGKWYIWDFIYGNQIEEKGIYLPLKLSLEEITKEIEKQL